MSSMKENGSESAVQFNRSENYPDWVRGFLRPEDVMKISKAVAAAELTTTGEIVPMIVHSSAIETGFWRLFIPLRMRQKLVLLRAELEFHRMHMRGTQARTGILIMASLYEHEVVVLADEAISKKLPAETWAEVVQLVLSGIKNKDTAGGFCNAIKKCGEILSQHFPASHKNPDELSNTLIIKE
jgi:uncharacterized membrane protein